MSLRYAGEGDPGMRGGPPGDLYVAVIVEPHPTLKRHNDDLIAEVTLSVSQAALGDKLDIELVEGEEMVEVGEKYLGLDHIDACFAHGPIYFPFRNQSFTSKVFVEVGDEFVIGGLKQLCSTGLGDLDKQCAICRNVDVHRRQFGR